MVVSKFNTYTELEGLKVKILSYSAPITFTKGFKYNDSMNIIFSSNFR